MPAGKRPSGYQQRKAKAEREAAEQAERDRVKDHARDLRAESFADLSPPPSDPALVMAWAHQVGARLLYQVVRDESIGEQERRRFASDLIAKIGMTTPRAQVAKKLHDLERKAGLADKTVPDADDFDRSPARAGGQGADGGDTDSPPDALADAPDEWDPPPDGGGGLG